ncbi:glycosyltransferase family 25 protein [Vibrio hyugaensis]|uniref:glycosyltransferase family 25 protein n=1 Tax=Vibrio hyugaensis TaxID=1534743 RepID=UPI003DA16614
MINIISLINSPKRANKHNFNFTFFDAIDNKNVVSNYIFDKDLAQLFYGRQLKNGEIGCTLSHFECISKFANSALSDEWLIILEDDVLPEKEFYQFLEEMKNVVASTEPEVFLLGHSKLNKNNNWIRLLKYPSYKNKKLASFDFMISNSNYCGTVGYVINKSAAKKMLEQKNRIFWITDDWHLVENMGINVYHPKSPLVYEDLGSISETGNIVHCSHSFKKHAVRNIYIFIVENLKKIILNKRIR